MTPDTIKTFVELVDPMLQTTVVDVGASPITETPPYDGLVKSGCAQLIGFEPDRQSLDTLNANKGPNETYFPNAVGDGRPKTLYATPATGLSSTKKLCPWVGSYFGPWWGKQAVRATEIPVSTVRLDAFDAVDRMDFLKIDIQGGELEVFENAGRLLSQTAMLQTEVALMSFYEEQPSFADIQNELTKFDLIPFRFATVNRRRIFSRFTRKLSGKIRPSQILDLDVVFVKNPVRLDQFDTELVKQMAILAFSVLGAVDLACKCLDRLTEDDPEAFEAFAEFLNVDVLKT
ncbi:FkbM family methyltransferase [Ruegeria sp. HKCCD7255]|uniref:FkbM family methyltransferase n=1 Tax=Ruegeria sp. HKCCD7255 TaxID=2683004 RepID=UPI001487651A